MLPDHNILEELKGISPTVAGIPRINVFSVPDGYFDTITSNILLNINQLNNRLGDVPQGYFDSLPDQIMNRIRQEDESSVLDGIPKTNVFTVPDSYFEELPSQIMSRLPKQAKVIGFNRTTSVFRYAIAACLTGLLGLMILSALNNTDNGKSTSTELAVDDGRKILQENSYNKVMESVTDDEITQFLQSSGQDVNTALMASLSEESELPDADEYIYDEQTLDRLMKDLHISQSAQN